MRVRFLVNQFKVKRSLFRSFMFYVGYVMVIHVDVSILLDNVWRQILRRTCVVGSTFLHWRKVVSTVLAIQCTSWARVVSSDTAGVCTLCSAFAEGVVCYFQDRPRSYVVLLCCYNVLSVCSLYLGTSSPSVNCLGLEPRLAHGEYYIHPQVNTNPGTGTITTPLVQDS